MNKEKIKKIGEIAIAIIIPLLVGGISSLLTMDGMIWMVFLLITHHQVIALTN